MVGGNSSAGLYNAMSGCDVSYITIELKFHQQKQQTRQDLIFHFVWELCVPNECLLREYCDASPYPSTQNQILLKTLK